MRTARLLTAIAVLLTGLSVAITAAATHSGARSAPTDVTTVRELPALRTANSDTFLRSDGTRLAKVYADPVNYRDSKGHWQPIDNTLKREGASWKPAASPTIVTLPATAAAGPISLGPAGSRVSFQLDQAATGEAAASGSQLTYKAVRPGVSVAYAVSSIGLRETLSLENANAPTSYTYKLNLTPGLHASANASGAITITGAAGKPVYTIAPPTAVDSAPGAHLPRRGIARYELSSDGTELTLTIDKAWLANPQRVFPVHVDPDVYYGDQSDCTIISERVATANFCGGPLYVGSDTEKPADIARAMLQFDLSCIPRDAIVLRSSLALWFNADDSTEPVEVDANGLTRSFTQNATWNTYDGTNAWSKAGGDFTEPLAGRQTMPEEWTNGWVSIGYNQLVEQWIQQPSSNHGILLKSANEAKAGYDEFLQANNSAKAGEPNMNIIYSARTGINEGDVAVGEETAGGAEIAVNAANGNLIVTSPDVQYDGEGYETKLTRYYNSEDENLVGPAFGPGWVLNTGQTNLLYPNWFDRSYSFHEPGGGWTRFDPTEPATGKTDASELTYKPTGASEATLVQHEDGTRTITTDGTEWQLDNSENGFPQKIIELEGEGNTVSLSYTESKLTKVADTHSHTLTLSYSGQLVTKIEAGSEKWEYKYDSNERLVAYKNPEGAETTYSYDSEGQLDELKDPTGTYIILYDPSYRVKSVRKIVNGTPTEVGSEDEIASYEYKSPESPTCNPTSDTAETTVTFTPETGSESYCFDASDHITGPDKETVEENEEEPESERVSEPEISAGTCTEAETFKDCTTAETPPEEEPDLLATDYGIADNNWILAHPHTKKEEEKHEIHEPFNYFTEEAFQNLGSATNPGVMRVRRTIPWNMALEAKYYEEKRSEDHGALIEREDVESWVEEVKKLDGGKGEPIISFERCPKGAVWADPTVPAGESDVKSCESAPSWQAYQDALNAFFARPVLAQVQSFTAWNEPDHPYQPTSTTGKEGKHGGAYLAGQYWRVLDDTCLALKAGCIVAAGDFSDIYMFNAEHNKYFWEYIEGTGRPNTLYHWAWHAYKDGVTTQQFTDKNERKKWWVRFKHFRNAVNHAMRNASCDPKYEPSCNERINKLIKEPNIWLTEQGVVYFEENEAKESVIKTVEVAKHHKVRIWHPKDASGLAERILRAYVDGKNHLSEQKQVVRFFYYSMRGAPKFDSGLLEPTAFLPGFTYKPGKAANSPREIYRIYQDKTRHGG